MWNAVLGWGMGLAHCWVLKHQAPHCKSACGGSVVLVPPFVLLIASGGGGGLVGLLFEICIVDASIN